MLRSNGVRRPKMDLRDLPKDLYPPALNQLFGGGFDRRGHPPLQSHSKLLSFSFKPVNERFAGQNRSRPYRNVRFSSRPLLDVDLTAVAKQ